MADENTLNKHLADFKKSVKKLEDAVKRSGVEWKDAQFTSLSNSIKRVAAASKQVLAVGGQCVSAIKRFNSIESER